MPKIQRKTQKIFCSSADSDQIAVFGSMATGTPVYSNDVEQLQSNEAYEIGWDAATLEDKAPFMEEMNGVQYGLTYQLAYNFQEGIPEYDAETTYYIGSIVKTLVSGKPVLYTSITDNNIGNDLTDVTNWEELKLGGGAGLQLFDTVLKDHVLTYEESKGLALQGTYVYKTAVAGSRYGYPDFYNKCLEERNTATATQVTLSGSTITMYVASNGHQYYDIADKDIIDIWYNTYGIADFYGVDTTNERIFLPRGLHGQLIESYVSGENGYRIYADGYCVQWGTWVNTATTNGATLTIDLIKTFKDTDYTLTRQPNGFSGGDETGRDIGFNSKTTNSFVCTVQSESVTASYLWQAEGYLAEGQYTVPLRLKYYVVGNTNTVFVKTVEVSSDSAEAPITFDNETNAIKLSVNEDFKIDNAGNLALSDNSPVIDGEWVNKAATLNEATTAGEYTVDLSEYLPNDGYDYEVLFNLIQNSTASALAQTSIETDVLPDMGKMAVTNSASTWNTNWCVLPVGQERWVKKTIIGNTVECFLGAYGYRRMGTNR